MPEQQCAPPHNCIADEDLHLTKYQYRDEGGGGGSGQGTDIDGQRGCFDARHLVLHSRRAEGVEERLDVAIVHGLSGGRRSLRERQASA